MSMQTPHISAITLEILPENEQDPDPAAVHTFATHAIQALHQHGYQSQPVSTGQRGGGQLVFQIVSQSILAMGPVLLAQKDTIDVISGLCTIFTTVKELLWTLFHVSQKQPPQAHAITVRIKIDEAEMELTSADIADDERILHLAERFYALHPSVKVTPQSPVTVQARVPKQPPRRRR
jgi:hypothetical protein